jgi:hypothetical protein
MLLRCLQPTSKHAPAIELAAAERLVFAQLGNKRGLSLATGQFDSKPEGAATLAEDPDGDDLLIQSDDATVVQEAQERIKKGADQAIEANADYGDAHGRLDAKTASLLLPPELAGQVGNSDLQFAFHLDATDALQLTIDASGSATTAGEIAHAVERTLRDMREEARDAGELALVRLLDSCEFRVTPDGFRLEATVAPELAAEILRGCAGEDGATPS